MITDHQYHEFLILQLADQQGKNPLLLSEWESHFLASFRASNRQSLWLTEGRRKSVDRMWMKYGGELAHPHPLDTVAAKPTPAPADPTGCEFLVRGDDGRQQRCNEPAVCREVRGGRPIGLRYCQMHRDQIDQSHRRRGITLVFQGI